MASREKGHEGPKTDQTPTDDSGKKTKTPPMSIWEKKADVTLCSEWQVMIVRAPNIQMFLVYHAPTRADSMP